MEVEAGTPVVEKTDTSEDDHPRLAGFLAKALRGLSVTGSLDEASTTATHRRTRLLIVLSDGAG